MMKKTLLSMAIGLLPLMIAGTARADHPADFEVHNKTGFTIVSLYISESDDNEWGADILGQETLESGKDADITFKGNPDACKWDIKLEGKDGKGWIVEDVDLCEVHEMSFAKKGDKVVYSKE